MKLKKLLCMFIKIIIRFKYQVKFNAMSQGINYHYHYKVNVKKCFITARKKQEIDNVVKSSSNIQQPASQPVVMVISKDLKQSNLANTPSMSR